MNTETQEETEETPEFAEWEAANRARMARYEGWTEEQLRAELEARRSREAPREGPSRHAGTTTSSRAGSGSRARIAGPPSLQSLQSAQGDWTGAIGSETQPLGRPGSRTCEYCDAEVAKRVAERIPGLWAWRWPEHDCPEGRAAEAERLRLEADEERRRAEQRRHFHEHPPDWRIAEIRQRCLLPRRAPPGLHAMILGPHSAAATRSVLPHREIWLAGNRPERGLWLWGETNFRKTYSVAALFFDVAHRMERSAYVWNFEWVMQQLQLSAKGERSRYDASAARRAELLLLDDIGTINLTLPAWRTLYGIVNDAMNEWGSAAPCQTLYVTSNESPDTLCRELSPPGKPDGGDRIIRRLSQLCEIVEVTPV